MTVEERRAGRGAAAVTGQHWFIWRCGVLERPNLEWDRTLLAERVLDAFDMKSVDGRPDLDG